MTVVPYQQNASIALRDEPLTPDQVELVKRTIAKGASDDELALFIYQCDRTRLDPFSRQIYCIGRKDWSQGGKEVFQTQASIDGLRLVAQRTGEYRGQTPVQWTGDGVNWVDVWLAETHPAAARVGTHRQGFVEPMVAVATWKEYVQTYTKNGKRITGNMWEKMGPLMIGKCAEALSLRRAFPMELSGIYTPEEMGQQDNDAPEVSNGRQPAQRPRSGPAPRSGGQTHRPPPQSAGQGSNDVPAVPGQGENGTDIIDAEVVSLEPEALTEAIGGFKEVFAGVAAPEKGSCQNFIDKHVGKRAKWTTQAQIDEATTIAAGWPASRDPYLAKNQPAATDPPPEGETGDTATQTAESGEGEVEAVILRAVQAMDAEKLDEWANALGAEIPETMELGARRMYLIPILVREHLGGNVDVQQAFS